MAANFEALCGALCELVGADAPELARDAGGVTAFTLDRGRGEVSVLERADSPGIVMVLLNLGRLEGDDDAACRVLMEVNFLMVGRPASPCMARNPVSGEFVVHYSRKLDELTACELYDAISHMEDISGNWQNGAVLREASASRDLDELAARGRA